MWKTIWNSNVCWLSRVTHSVVLAAMAAFTLLRQKWGPVWPPGPKIFTDLSFAKKLDPAFSPSWEHQGRRCADTPRGPCCWGETGQAEPAYSRTGKESCLTIPGSVRQCPKVPLLTRVCLTSGEGGWQLQVKPWLWPLPSSEFFFSPSTLVFCFPSTPNFLLFHLYFLNPFSG